MFSLRSLGVKRPERGDHTPPSSAEAKECVDLYLHFPIRLYGVVLRDTGAALLTLPPRPDQPWGHPASIHMITGVLSPLVKRPGHEADHSSPSNTKVKNTWSYTSNPIRLHDVVLS